MASTSNVDAVHRNRLSNDLLVTLRATLYVVSDPVGALVADRAGRAMSVDDMFRAANESLDRVKGLLSRVGIAYFDLPRSAVGVGIAVAWSETRFVVISVMGGGNEGQLWITCGVLQNVNRDRLAALDAGSGRTRDNSAYPVFLHDAEVGWDVLMQQSYPLQLIFDIPAFFSAYIESMPVMAEQAAPDMMEKLGGTRHRWREDDLRSLLLRSMM